MKKVISLILIFSLMCFFAAGCGRRGTTALGISSKKTSERITTNNTDLQSNKSSSEKTTGSNSAEVTSSKMQETSNLMDKLDITLNGLDNSSDITTTETIINNIN